MSEVIVAASIGAMAAIIAAFIPEWIRQRADRKRLNDHAQKDSVQVNGVAGGLPGQIIEAVRCRILGEPFSAADIRDQFPENSLPYIRVVLPNNAVDGNYGTNYFVRVAPGQYRVADTYR